MTEQERANLKRRFEEISKQLDSLVDSLLALETENERLSQTQLYTSLLESVRDGEDYAKSLADYIDHASGENWKMAK